MNSTVEDLFLYNCAILTKICSQCFFFQFNFSKYVVGILMIVCELNHGKVNGSIVLSIH